MKTTPLATPGKVPGALNGQTQSSPSAQAARERAIARLTEAAKPQAQETPVQNPTQVAPEELSAIHKPTQETPIETATTEGQADKVVEEPKATTPPAEQPLSAQYAQLARKEKALRAQAQALKAERDAFQKAQDAAKPKETAPQVDTSQYIPKERLSRETLAVLAEQGISYEQLTQLALNGAPTQEAIEYKNTINELRAEIKALRDETTETKTSFQKQQADNYQQAVAQIKQEAKNLVAVDPRFETVQATNSVEDAVELITRTFETDGTLLTVEEALEAVEDHLLEEAVKLASLKKVQNRLKPAGQAAPKQPGVETKQEPPAQAKTLTNAIATPRKLSSKERAILAFKGEKF